MMELHSPRCRRQKRAHCGVESGRTWIIHYVLKEFSCKRSSFRSRNECPAVKLSRLYVFAQFDHFPQGFPLSDRLRIYCVSAGANTQPNKYAWARRLPVLLVTHSWRNVARLNVCACVSIEIATAIRDRCKIVKY